MGIEFEEDKSFSTNNRIAINERRNSKIIKFLVDREIVKNESQAKNVLIACSVIFFISAIIIFYINFFSSGNTINTVNGSNEKTSSNVQKTLKERSLNRAQND